MTENANTQTTNLLNQSNFDDIKTKAKKDISLISTEVGDLSKVELNLSEKMFLGSAAVWGGTRLINGYNHQKTLRFLDKRVNKVFADMSQILSGDMPDIYNTQFKASADEIKKFMDDYNTALKNNDYILAKDHFKNLEKAQNKFIKNLSNNSAAIKELHLSEDATRLIDDLEKGWIRAGTVATDKNLRSYEFIEEWTNSKEISSKLVGEVNDLKNARLTAYQNELNKIESAIQASHTANKSNALNALSALKDGKIHTIDEIRNALNDVKYRPTSTVSTALTAFENAEKAAADNLTTKVESLVQRFKGGDKFGKFANNIQLYENVRNGKGDLNSIRKALKGTNYETFAKQFYESNSMAAKAIESAEKSVAKKPNSLKARLWREVVGTGNSTVSKVLRGAGAAGALFSVGLILSAGDEKDITSDQYYAATELIRRMNAVGSNLKSSGDLDNKFPINKRKELCDWALKHTQDSDLQTNLNALKQHNYDYGALLVANGSLNALNYKGKVSNEVQKAAQQVIYDNCTYDFFNKIEALKQQAENERGPENDLPGHPEPVPPHPQEPTEPVEPTGPGGGNNGTGNKPKGPETKNPKGGPTTQTGSGPKTGTTSTGVPPINVPGPISGQPLPGTDKGGKKPTTNLPPEAIVQQPEEQSFWTWKNILMIGSIVATLGLSTYFIIKYKKKADKAKKETSSLQSTVNDLQSQVDDLKADTTPTTDPTTPTTNDGSSLANSGTNITNSTLDTVNQVLTTNDNSRV